MTQVALECGLEIVPLTLVPAIWSLEFPAGSVFILEVVLLLDDRGLDVVLDDHFPSVTGLLCSASFLTPVPIDSTVALAFDLLSLFCVLDRLGTTPAAELSTFPPLSLELAP